MRWSLYFCDSQPTGARVRPTASSLVDHPRTHFLPREALNPLGATCNDRDHFPGTVLGLLQLVGLLALGCCERQCLGRVNARLEASTIVPVWPWRETQEKRETGG